MLEKFRRSFEMSSAFVEDATEWAKALTLSEASRAGDYGNAMRRIARKIGVGFSVLKTLNYGDPKKVDAADFARLGTEYVRRNLHRNKQISPRTAIGRLLVDAADALDRVADSLDGR